MTIILITTQAQKDEYIHAFHYINNIIKAKNP